MNFSLVGILPGDLAKNFRKSVIISFCSSDVRSVQNMRRQESLSGNIKFPKNLHHIATLPTNNESDCIISA